MRKKDEKWGIFWCGLLRPVIFGEIEEQEVNRFLKILCTQEYLMPNGKYQKPSLSTLRRKLRQYRQEGFTGLARKRRGDRGKSRSADQQIIDKAIELKREQPLRSDMAINMILQEIYGKTLPKSTLYYHLKAAGATRLKLGIQKKKVRKRWTRDNTNELWIADFEYGPYVLAETEATPTYLSLLIDCHSRYVVEGRYYPRQDLNVFIDTLLRAWSTHGLCMGIYVDNGKVFHADQLEAACYDLGIDLIHSTPRDPSPKGLVERMFGTTQTQFESEVRAGNILTLEQLNKAFSAYLSVCYHERIHSEIGQTPKERYQKGLKNVRHVDMQKVIQFFMKRIHRIVNADFSDVQIDKRFYRVDPKFRGDKVEARWDPYGSLEKIFIYSLQEEYLGVGVLYNRDRGAELPNFFPAQGKPKHNFLDLIINRHEQRLQQQTATIDYRKVLATREWPFSSFVLSLARLMGRKGGISAFTCQEHEALKKIYNRYPSLSEFQLREAFEMAEEKNIVHVAYQLQILMNKRKE